MPPSLPTIANELLEYMHDDYNGERIPQITAAIWSDSKYLAAASSWRDVFRNGGHLLIIDVMNTREALKGIKTEI